MNKKTFGELGLFEIAEALIAQKMPDGTKIDPETVKESLYRVIPMVKDNLLKDKQALCLFTESDIKNLDPSYVGWQKHISYLQDLVDKGEAIIRSGEIC